MRQQQKRAAQIIQSRNPDAPHDSMFSPEEVEIIAGIGNKYAQLEDTPQNREMVATYGLDHVSQAVGILTGMNHISVAEGLYQVDAERRMNLSIQS